MRRYPLLQPLAANPISTKISVDNDFHRAGQIFRLFDDLEVKDLDQTLQVADHMKGLTRNGDSSLSATVNGTTNGAAAN